MSVHTSPLEQPGTGDGGGLNVYVVQVGRRLAAAGVDVEVWTRRTSPRQADVVEIADGLRVHRVDAGPPAPMDKQELVNHLCSFVLDMARRGPRVDVLHSHYWLSGWVARRIADRWDVPFLHTYHTLGVMKNAALAPGDVPEPPLRLAAERRIADAADRVVVLTCGEARLLHRTYGLSGAHIDVVNAGVDLGRFAAVPPADDRLRPGGGSVATEPLATTSSISVDDRLRLGGGSVATEPLATTSSMPVHRQELPELPDGAPVLLFVGRLQPLKGPDVAVRTLARVRERRPDAQLVIVGGVSGSGEGRTGPVELRALADDLDVAEAVHLLPARPQEMLAALYRRADVTVVPSRSETFGLVALESMACGTPVVAARVGGLAEVLRHGGGVLVDGHDPADHATAVLRVLDDPMHRDRLVADGLRRATDATWDHTAAKLLSIYADVLERRSPLERTA